MRSGGVATLFVLDANPVYEAPGAFAQALARVPFTIHAGLYRDETAHACGWHLPLSHDCERWGDALAHDGSVTLVQPAIAPLYDTRSPNELLALLARDALRDGYALVQRQWRAAWGADFDARWRDSLQRGMVEGSAAPAVPAPAKPLAALLAPVNEASATGLTALFAADPSTHDGRFANNAWLQELPRPFTKLTWDNALLLSPRDAAAIGAATGDVVRASVDEARIEAPVWVLATQAEGVVTVPLGYGRRAGGRVGDGVGFDGYALKPAGAVTAPVRLERLGRQHDFAVTQHTISQHGRELARTVRPGERIEERQHASLYAGPPRPEDGSAAWAMSIDLDACIGCNACTIACQAENNIPVVGKEQVALGREMHWIRVDRYEAPELAGSIFQPVPCMHCEKAPCELVCPVGATVHDTEGLNVQVYNRCVGTRFCSQNCPYKVRRFNFLQFSDETTESLKGQRNPNVTVRQRGVMEKCTYCLQRIARARQHAQAEGRPVGEGEVITACQAVCPTRAIRFGDLRHAGNAVNTDRQSPRHYALLGELNTQPRTTYLARVRRTGEPT
jgi:molybdopterin-containing oxidoreductase family iron-sulfur binding subunit